MDSVRRVLEPAQLGAGTPDGVAIAVRTLRGWALGLDDAGVRAAAAEAGEDVMDIETILGMLSGEGDGQDPGSVGEDLFSVAMTGTDLENAFGRMLRSRAMSATRRLAPALLPMLLGQWRRPVKAWQRVEEGWRCDGSGRGGWQGSRLTQVAFCIDLHDALASTRMVREGGVQRVGVADDLYLVGDAGAQAERWEDFEAILADHGHRLRRHKCKMWVPAAERSQRPLPEGVAALERIVPRVRGGMTLLGSAAQGDFETYVLGPVPTSG